MELDTNVEVIFSMQVTFSIQHSRLVHHWCYLMFNVSSRFYRCCWFVCLSAGLHKH